ncbi:MAG: protein kinase [Kofleriaceae bacterium]
MLVVTVIVDGRYRVLETMFESKTRTVYLTEHKSLHRKLVVKVLHPDEAKRPGAVERFMSEAKVASKLRHPNLVESTDMGMADGKPYVVFERLEGVLLSAELARIPRLPMRRAIHIARQIAAGLGAAHKGGVVHGHLDLTKVFLVRSDEDPDLVKVLGLGRLDPDATPANPAPEQARSEPADERSDVWAIGILMLQMLEGQPLSAELADVIAQCVAKLPADRYAHGDAVVAALEPFEQRMARGSIATPALAPEPPAEEVPPKAALPIAPAQPGSRRAVVLAGVAAVCAAGGLAFALWPRQPTSELRLFDPPVVVPDLPPAVAVAPISLNVAANANEASVTFRKHLTTLPATLELRPGEAPELLEVSAPGYKTMRYWITFDRPLRFAATLARGNGLVEATEHQTRIALGEPADPDPEPVSQPPGEPVDAPPASEPRRLDAAAFAANRISGTVAIQPNTEVRQAMQHFGRKRIAGKLTVCVSAAGSVTGMTMTRSSGFGDFDKAIRRELRTWRFTALGEPVCGPVSIEYTQD